MIIPIPGATVARGARLVVTSEKTIPKGSEGAVVIGRDMLKRVIPYAEKAGASHINDAIPYADWSLRKNIKWMWQQIWNGKIIIDIGPGTARNRSSAYIIERAMTRTFCW